jgi:glutamate synthase (NADPH/NADH) small chain
LLAWRLVKRRRRPAAALPIHPELDPLELAETELRDLVGRGLLEKGFVKQVECVKMQLGEPDASGRRRPITIPGSEFKIDADTVVIAIGQSPNPLVRQTTKGLEANDIGALVVDPDTLETTRKGVFAGGDIISGGATVIRAMGEGKKAAKAIDAYLKSK